MKRLAATLLALVLVAILVAPAAAQTKYESGVYWIILVEHGPNWKSQATDEGAKRKMAAIQGLRESIIDGEIIIAGLVIDDMAADFVIIVKADDENKLRAQIANSANVKNGHYKARTLAWHAPKGLKLEPIPIPGTGQ